ncbi:MAG: DUF4199 domain-containing protein [Steroidobacteraceae bacterium]|jgi:hypothetical protein|nr:DUF4199 domain-containing protein [Steroidobacteraceae bacterium]
MSEPTAGGRPGEATGPARGPVGDPPRVAPAAPTDIAIRFGLIGGLLASVFIVGPPLLAPALGGALTDYAGLMIAMLAVWMGSRALGVAHPRLPYTRRLVLGSTIVATASLVVGFALYALYAWLRPTLLAERYAALEGRVRASGREPGEVATELERLARQQVQYLDPAFQAVATAGTLFFFGMILALYAAWRWRVVQRLGAMRGDGGAAGPR